MPIELPRDLPAGIESGGLDTPLGSARWAHLSGEFGTLPGTLEPHRAAEGFVAERPGELRLPEQVYVFDGSGDYDGLVAVLRSATGESDYHGFVLDARLFAPIPETASAG